MGAVKQQKIDKRKSSYKEMIKAAETLYKLDPDAALDTLKSIAYEPDEEEEEVPAEQKQPQGKNPSKKEVDDDKVGLAEQAKNMAGGVCAVVVGAITTAIVWAKDMTVAAASVGWDLLKGAWHFIRGLFTRENLGAVFGWIKRASNIAVVVGLVWLVANAVTGGALMLPAYVIGGAIGGSAIGAGINRMCMDDEVREETTFSFVDMFNPLLSAA